MQTSKHSPLGLFQSEDFQMAYPVSRAKEEMVSFLRIRMLPITDGA
nr:MAG TPA: hypothetical protein [Caudoviricetes sp.]